MQSGEYQGLIHSATMQVVSSGDLVMLLGERPFKSEEMRNIDKVCSTCYPGFSSRSIWIYYTVRSTQ